MKTTKILGMLMVFFCFIGMTACNDDDYQPFNLDVEAFELPIRGNHVIEIWSGSGKVNCRVEHPEIASVSYREASSVTSFAGLGEIHVGGVSKGKTMLYVEDEVTGESARVEVKVTDAYLGFIITKSNHPEIPENKWLYLVDDGRNGCCFFDNSTKGLPVGKPFREGVFDIVTEESEGKRIPYLIMPTMAGESVKFDIMESSSSLFYAMNEWFRLGWYMNESRTSVISPPMLIMKDVETGASVEAICALTKMPEGVLE